jgi:hypothetical protein
VQGREIVGEGANERFARLPAERGVEPDDPGGGDVERGEGVEFLGGGLQQERRVLGGDDRVGMPVEGDDDRQVAAAGGIGGQAADDFLVAEVDAVKNAEREGDTASGAVEFVGLGEDLHPA